jgi:imidazolonepropionase-like amidohydrolase
MNKNLFKIPLFQDHHMHFLSDGRAIFSEDGCDLIRKLISFGITTVKDMGHKSGLGLKIKGKPVMEEQEGFRIFSAGWALSKKGGYGGFLGKEVSGKKEIQKAIRELTASRVDFIKIINSGIVLFGETKLVSEGGFSREEWKVILEEAGLQGFPIICHANTDEAIRMAVDFGVSSIEHGFFISRETLYQMVEKGVSWTPTAGALLSLKTFLPAEEHIRLDRILDHHLEAIEQAASLGVRLQVGTDSGSKGILPGESFFKELQLLRRTGLRLEQILSAACQDQAEIEKGNYLLVHDNFIDEKNVRAVYLNGVKR